MCVRPYGTPGPAERGPGLHGRSAAVVALILVALITLIALILRGTIAVAVLVEATTLGRLTIAIAHVLLVAILIAARSPLFPMLFVVPFLIGHRVFPPSAPATWWARGAS
jgi:hypothetical protein